MAPIRVVYDATPLGLAHANPRSRTGIFRVAERTIAAALAEPALAVSLAAFSGREEAVLAELHCRARGPGWLNRFRRTWRAVAIPHRLVLAARAAGVPRRLAYAALARRPLDRHDIAHSFYDPLPDPRWVPARVRVLTVHDLAPLRLPALFEPATAAHFAAILASIDPTRDWVVCVSEATRRDLLAAIPIDPARVAAIPLAADDRFRPPAAAAVARWRERCGIGAAPYLACLSAVGPRKNLDRLLGCVAGAIRAGRVGDLRVVIAGPAAAGADAVAAAAADPALAGRVVFTGFIADEDLPTFLGGAVALAYPSLYEGFGLPPLEAMACGTPVICGDNSSLPEVVGDGGLLVDVADPRALTEAVVAVVGDPRLRGDLAARALRQASRFTWARTLDAQVGLYRRALASAQP